MRSKKCCHCGQTMQNFADFTTIHGFREFYYAKSAFWKIVWLTVIVAAIAVSVYQLYNSTVSALEQPTTTIIQPISQDAEYPPFKICYIHWMYWVNWALVYKLGFDRNTLLYAVSFLTDILSDEWFNVTEVKSNFDNAMKKNNLETLMQFYSAVSYEKPPGIEIDWENWTKILDPYDSYFCFVATTDMVINALQANIETGKMKDRIQLMNRYNNSERDYTNIHKAEVVQYLKKFAILRMDPASKFDPNITDDYYLNFKAAPLINVDSDKTKYIMPSKDNFQITIKLTITMYKWLSNTKRPCNDGEANWYFDNCGDVCYWQEYQRITPNGCLSTEAAILLNKETKGNICQHSIYFLDRPELSSPGNNLFEPLKNVSQSYNSCLAEYCTPPCVQWQFASTVSNLPLPIEASFLNFPTVIFVEYPNPATILAVNEVLSQTWETFVGNLGGIVGLWLGASIISVGQMLYLICCENCDEKIARSCHGRGNEVLDMHSRVFKPKSNEKKTKTIIMN